MPVACLAMGEADIAVEWRFCGGIGRVGGAKLRSCVSDKMLRSRRTEEGREGGGGGGDGDNSNSYALTNVGEVQRGHFEG